MIPRPLTDHERAILLYFRDQGTPAEARRAQVVLLSDENAPTANIAAAVSLSPNRVRHWVRAWHAQGLGIFERVPEHLLAGQGVVALATPNGADESLAVEAADEDEAEAAPPGPPPGVEAPRLPLELREQVGVLPDDPMAEAGRKVLYYHFERMLLNEPGSRLGEDIEAVHDMRVATRRMRSAMRLFAPFFEDGIAKRYRKGLRATGDALGAVRDLDVFEEKAAKFMQANPEADLGPLFEAWDQQLQQARAALIEYLDSRQFARFVERFHTFLTTPGLGALPVAEGGVPIYQVRHVLPPLIYDLYERVRAYETVVEGAPITTLHALRIEFKRLRYALEFFEEVLGPEARRVIKEIKVMQDHLGDLNDAEVAGQLLRAFVDEQSAIYSGIPLFIRPDISGVMHYATAKQAEKEHLLATFPEAWANFLRADVRRDLAVAVAAL
ncbi:MAG: CHAD domain-containing protein [Chloroflexi bacterium]|nr:CHAD domain-containing protein [Chloroflexota bacterium]